jgi:hypothetical protein
VSGFRCYVSQLGDEAFVSFFTHTQTGEDGTSSASSVVLQFPCAAGDDVLEEFAILLREEAMTT